MMKGLDGVSLEGKEKSWKERLEEKRKEGEREGGRKGRREGYLARMYAKDLEVGKAAKSLLGVGREGGREGGRERKR
jgi:hypothetical protein